MRFFPGLRLNSTLLVLLLAAACVQSAFGETFNVSDVTGLRAALLSAAANGQDDVIVLAAGTYATGGSAFTFATSENKTLTLQGADGTTRDQVILDGGSVSRVLDFGCVGTCGEITLRRLTVQNGSVAAAPAFGGGAKSIANLVIDDSIFANNSAADFPLRVSGIGGAIYGGAVTVMNSVFSHNFALGSAGGISGSTVTVTNSIFDANSAGENTPGHTGACGAISGSSVNVMNSIFSNNSAARTSSSGGAICGAGAIISVTFSGNSAGFGAAISGVSGPIINSVFYGNGFGVDILGGSGYNVYYNLIDTPISGAITVGNIAPGPTSPFVDAAQGNFRLAAGSLAINAGLDPNSTAFANLLSGFDVAAIRQALLTDLDGNPRPTPGTGVDMGAYEYRYFTVTGAANPLAGGSVSCTSPVSIGSIAICSITTYSGYTLTGVSSDTCGGSLAWSTYTTGAVTSACIVTASFTSAATTTPSAPTAVSATAGAGSIVVNFSPPTSNGGGAIIGYAAICTSSDGGVSGSNTGGANATSIRVSGLTYGTSYTCTVTASNSVGASPVSAPSNVVIPAVVNMAPILMLLLN